MYQKSVVIPILKSWLKIAFKRCLSEHNQVHRCTVV